ncbi:chaplin family protein [Streptomyces sp. NPDC002537]
MRRVSVATALAVAGGLGCAGTAVAGGPHTVAVGEPGILTGDIIQIPLKLRPTVCGNAIDIILGLANPANGSFCPTIDR